MSFLSFCIVCYCYVIYHYLDMNRVRSKHPSPIEFFPNHCEYLFALNLPCENTDAFLCWLAIIISVTCVVTRYDFHHPYQAKQIRMIMSVAIYYY